MKVKIEIFAEVNQSDQTWAELQERIELQILKLTNEKRDDFGLTRLLSVSIKQNPISSGLGVGFIR